MVLPCLYLQVDNNLKSTTSVVKSVSINASHCQMLKSFEFLSAAVLIQRKTSSLNACIFPSNMLVSISRSDLFTLLMVCFTLVNPETKLN